MVRNPALIDLNLFMSDVNIVKEIVDFEKLIRIKKIITEQPQESPKLWNHKSKKEFEVGI